MNQYLVFMCLLMVSFGYEIGHIVQTPIQQTFNLTIKAQIYEQQVYNYTFDSNSYTYFGAFMNYTQILMANISCRWYSPSLDYSIIRNQTLKINSSQEVVKSQYFAQQDTLILITSVNKLIQFSQILQHAQQQDVVHYNGNFKRSFRYGDCLWIVTSISTYVYNITSKQLQETTYFDSTIKILDYKSQSLALTQSELIFSMEKRIDFGTGTKLADAVIFDNQAYVLDQKLGIYLLDLETLNFIHYSINIKGYFRKLWIFNTTIHIVYELQKRNYLVELYHINGSVDINKVYKYNHNVKDLIVYPRYAVLVQEQYLTMFLHSVNRLIKHENIMLKQISFTYDQLFVISDDIFIATHTSGFQVIKIQRIIPKYFSCKFPGEGTYKVAVKFGLDQCSFLINDPSIDPKSGQCIVSTVNEVKVYKNLNSSTALVANIILSATLGVCLVCLLIIAIYYRKKIQARAEDVEKLQANYPTIKYEQFNQQTANKLPQKQQSNNINTNATKVIDNPVVPPQQNL